MVKTTKQLFNYQVNTKYIILIKNDELLILDMKCKPNMFDDILRCYCAIFQLILKNHSTHKFIKKYHRPTKLHQPADYIKNKEQLILNKDYLIMTP